MNLFTVPFKLNTYTIAEVEKDLAGLQDRKIGEVFAHDYNLMEYKEHMELATKWAVKNSFKLVFYEEVLVI